MLNAPPEKVNDPWHNNCYGSDTVLFSPPYVKYLHLIHEYYGELIQELVLYLPIARKCVLIAVILVVMWLHQSLE